MVNTPKLKRIRLENGEYLDSETYAAVQVMSTMVGKNLFPFISNGSYSTRVQKSGMTHSGAGVFDLDGARLGRAMIVKCVSAWRRITAGRGTAWLREGAKWVNNMHGHFVLVTAETHESAVNQFKDYLRGGDGLTGKGVDNGPRDWVNGTPNPLITGAITATEGEEENWWTTPIDIDPYGIKSKYDSVTAFLDFMARPDTPKRILLVVLGFILCIIALMRMTTLPIDLNIPLGKALK